MQLQFPWFCVGHPECFLVLDHFLFAEVYKLLFIHGIVIVAHRLTLDPVFP